MNSEWAVDLHENPQHYVDMMGKQFCILCGNKFEDESKFCPECGVARVKVPAPEPILAEPQSVLAGAPEEPEKKAKKIGCALVGLIGIQVIGVLIVLFSFAFSSSTSSSDKSYSIDVVAPADFSVLNSSWASKAYPPESCTTASETCILVEFITLEQCVEGTAEYEVSRVNNEVKRGTIEFWMSMEQGSDGVYQASKYVSWNEPWDSFKVLAARCKVLSQYQ
jgi:hypothetical protein